MSQFLNYFTPYTSKKQGENSLTRAFMSLLRLCPIVQQGFYQMIREAALPKLKATEVFPPYFKLDSLTPEILIQQQQLPISNYYLSVLLSGEPIALSETISPEKRKGKAQYDGIFTIDERTFFIENKPHNDLNELQLCPAKKDLADKTDYHLFDFAVNLTWREIITYLTKVVDAGLIDPTQTTLISDFLSYVDNSFAQLNPFDRFDLCTSKSLVLRRIESLLKEIAAKPDAVKWHKGWAHVIPTPKYEYMGELGAPLWNYEKEGTDWHFDIAIILADTVTQARKLYQYRPLNLSRLADFKAKGWTVKPNLHLGFMESNMVFFETKPEQLENYIQYWKDNSIGELRDTSGNKNVFNLLNSYLEDLHQKDIIIYNDERKNEVFKCFGGSKNRKKVSIRPGLYIGKHYHKTDAEKLDRMGTLSEDIRTNIIDFFEVITTVFPSFIKTK